MNEHNTTLELMAITDLLSSGNFQSFKQRAYDLMDSKDWDSVLDLSKSIETRLRVFAPENEQEKYWSAILRFWIFRLKLFAFDNLNPGEKQELIQNHALELVRWEFDLEAVLFDNIEFYGSRSEVEQETNSIVAWLRGDQEILGANLPSFKQVGFFPTVGNWILQYQTVLNKRKIQEINPGAFELTSFFNSNQYVRLLSEEEKNDLKIILDLYNFSLFPIVVEAAKPALGKAPFIPVQHSPMGRTIPMTARPSIVSAAPKAVAAPVVPMAPKIPVAPMPPKPPVVPIVPKPQTKPSVAPEPTEFEKKLSQVSAPVPHGADLDALKHKLEENKVSFSSKKQNEGEENTEGGREMQNEIKREVMTKELPSPETASVKPISAPAPKPVEIKKPQIETPKEAYKAPLPEKQRNPFEGGRWDTPKASGSISESHVPVPEAKSSTALKRLSDIATVEDLKLIDIAHLKQGPINNQVELIRSKILNVTKQKNVLPFYGVSAFEQSPLFKAYLKVGTEMIGNNSVDRAEAFREIASRVGSNLKLEEFEAVADLRKEIERL